MMYSLSGYADMIADAVRVDAYVRALRSVIRPQSFVVEIGTGIGVFAVLARQMGARRVVAIEPSDAIAVARLIANENDQPGIEFIQALSKDVTLSEPADVVFSDLRGVLPPFNGHLHSIIDARHRILAPGGALIPSADTLYAAVVEAPDSCADQTPPFTANGEVKLEALRPFITNNWAKARFKPERLLTKPEAWATIDYRTVVDSHVEGTASFTVNRQGTAHGLAVWFDATLVDGVSFSNAPDQPQLIYGSAFFPWPDPVDLREGDRICVRLEARHVGDDYVWRWGSEVWPPGATAPAARFQQSTFHGQPIVPSKLTKGDAAQVPRLSEDGRVERCILQLMDGVAANHDIARTLVERFPNRFPKFNDALARVGSVARRFGLD
jgi:type I protein arginine methyltransferase